MTGHDVVDGPEGAGLLQVRVHAEVDDELRDRWCRQLRSDLAALDVDGVCAAPRQITAPGAKGVDVGDVSALLVSLGTAGGLLTVVVGTVRDWLARHGDAQKVSLTMGGDTLVLDRATAAERSEVVEAFLRRHGEPA